MKRNKRFLVLLATVMTDESKSILSFSAHNLWASDFLRGASYLYSSLEFSMKFSLNLQGNKKMRCWMCFGQ